MAMWRGIKRRAKSVAPSVVLLAVAAYFGWSATQGDRGLQAYARQHEQLRVAQAELGRTTAEVDAWERRVGALHTTHLDPDMLDERARVMLNVADPTDVVVVYGQGKKLF